MILICCVDEHNGMAFEGRRTSQDRFMRDDIRSLFSKLSMSAYTYQLYVKDDVNYDYEVCESPCDAHYPYVLETQEPSRYIDQIEMIVLYQWHRQYPYTLQMDINLHDEQWECMNHYCFVGSSHDKITRAIFQRR